MTGRLRGLLAKFFSHRQPEVIQAEHRVISDRVRTEKAAARVDTISAAVADLLRGSK